MCSCYWYANSFICCTIEESLQGAIRNNFNYHVFLIVYLINNVCRSLVSVIIVCVVFLLHFSFLN